MNMLTQNDLELIAAKNISIEQMEEQLNAFANGFPYLPIAASASIEKGLWRIPENEQTAYINAWQDYLAKNKAIVKFVPASGAASRMFKDLFEFLTADYTLPSTTFEQTFFENIRSFAFYPALNHFCILNEGKSVDELTAAGQHKKVVENLLYDKGLNYGNSPKGLILFHSYSDGARTAMEEHLVEGALYACNQARNVNVHFTVSPENRDFFEVLTREKTVDYAQRFEVNYQICFSEQKTSTDTLAVDADNQPFRESGQLVFRPGGHGALIQNLNDIEADVAFIKNIDNVTPDGFKPETIHYKRLIAGILVSYQQKMFDYLALIDSGKYTHGQLIEMLYFLQDRLCIKNPDTKHLEDV